MKKIGNQVYELNILMGLPGSGKSYYAKNNFHESSKYAHYPDFIVDLDKHMHDDIEMTVKEACDDSDLKVYCNELHPYGNVPVKVCVDGLITTKDNLYNVVKNLIEYISKYHDSKWRGPFDVHLIVHQWKEDREGSLHNDALRVKCGERTLSSKISIENCPYETIGKEDLEQLALLYSCITNTNIVKHKFHWCNYYDIVLRPLVGIDRNEYYGGRCHNENTPGKTKYMYSEDWSGGGTWSNYKGDEGSIEADSPKEFVKLDKLLEKIAPNITYLQYKKIEKKCISIEETREYDYYGGCETNLRWKCDLEALYDLLKEMKLIPID